MYGFNSTNVPEIESNEDDEPQEVNPKFNLGNNHQGRYGPVKSQIPTNACWAFAATAVLEGHTAIINGRYTALSEQEVADCTPGSTILNGGFHNHALQAVQRTQHLATAADFPFTRRDGNRCNTQHRNALPFRITGVNQIRGDQGLASALASGPVASGMKFHSKLETYNSGIYQDRSCQNTNPNPMSALFSSSLSITSSSRDNTRALTHILTGHNYLRYFQHKIGNEPDDTCKKCDEAPETTEHFLTQCPALIMERHSCFGNFTIRTGNRHFSLPPKAILNFSILTKYLDFFEPP